MPRRRSSFNQTSEWAPGKKNKFAGKEGGIFRAGGVFTKKNKKNLQSTRDNVFARQDIRERSAKTHQMPGGRVTRTKDGNRRTL